MKNAGIALAIALMLAMPLSFAFSGSGDGYNLTQGIEGFWAGLGTGDGLNITLGLYGSPFGSGTDGIFSIDIRNFFSEAETDADPPIVSLVSPGDWHIERFSQMMTFTYNVSDHNPIANCTLVLDLNGITTNYTNSSVTNNAGNSFTVSVPNGIYNWSIECIDNSTARNKGVSGQRSFQISYSASSAGGGGCYDECTPGERICKDGSIIVCGNVDSDRCTEWTEQDCLADETCEGGQCVKLPCVEDWVCSEWSSCENEYQSRQCKDWNACGTPRMKPPEARACEKAAAEEEVPAAVTGGETPSQPAAPEQPKQPSKVLAAVKSAAKYTGISLGALTLLIAIILGSSLFISKTSFFLKQTFSTEAILLRLAERGIPEEKILNVAAKKGYPEADARRIVRNFRLNRINATIEQVSKDMESY